MSDSPFPYNFPMGEIYPEIIKKFIVHAMRNNVSDITIQGGDYIYVKRYGREIQASNMLISDTTLKELIGLIWGADIVSTVVSGEDVDRALSISGELFDLQRSESVRLRSNFIQANVGKLQTICVTSRIIKDELPTFAKFPLEEEFKREIFATDGVVVFGGPTGSGKTTSQTACFMHIGEHFPDRKVITFEQPIEYILSGPHWKGVQPAQSEVGRDIASFSAGVRNGMRRAPKIIGVGEARDHETYSGAIEAAKSGHLVFFTIHIDKVGELFSRVTQAFPVEQQASIAFDLLSKIRVVMVQNLFKSTDGKMLLIREGLVFTPEIKHQLENLHHSKWSMWVETYMTEREATIKDKLWHAFSVGMVSQEEFISKVSHHEFLRRTERQNEK